MLSPHVLVEFGTLRLSYLRDQTPPLDPDRYLLLLESIWAHGILQPLLVRPRGADFRAAGRVAGRWQEIDHFEILAGGKRWRIAEELGIESLPCVLLDVDDATALEIIWAT